MQSKYIPFLFLIHCVLLLPHEGSLDSDYNVYSVPHVTMQLNNYNAQPPSNCYFSAHVNEIPDYSYKLPANYSVLEQASPLLRDFFITTVSPLMYDAMIKNHCAAIPGYTFPDGLRHCIHQLSQFSCTDAALIASIAKRLETYCTFTEGILFSGKDHSFCDAISYKDQVQLVRAYADFLKEFYTQSAPYIFYQQSQENALMQHAMSSINWNYYNGNDLKSSSKKIEQRRAASLHGSLGAVCKALHEGDIEKAYIVGREPVKTVVYGKLFGKTEQTTSVFEWYPLLYEHVEQVYSANKAQIEQERLIKQNIAQKGAAFVHAECSNGIKVKALIPGFDILQQRNDAAISQVNNPEFLKKIHTVLAEQADYIDVQHLTSDQKGILLDGGYLQHHIVDEAITVVDVVISNDLVENVQDAVLDLANVSLMFNKDGDVVAATRTLDACWALIDYAQDVARYTYSIASTHLPLVAKGACDGVCESLHGVVHTVCHPVEAAKDAAQSMVVAGYYLGKAFYKAGEYESMIDCIETEPHNAQGMLQKLADEPLVLLAAYEYAKKNVSTEDVARVGTKTVLDMMLLHGVTKAVSAIAQESWVEFISCMRKGEQSSDIALTAENISVQCGEEIASVMESMQKMCGGITNEKVVSEINSTKIWSNSQSFTALNKKIEELKLIIQDSPINSLIGADSSINKISIIEKEASTFYEAMRCANFDVEKIAANTGISKKTIQQVKNHIFKDNHLLGDKIAKFDPDPDMANAWKRLIEGNFVQVDLKLLQHEYAELLIMQGDIISYDIAHSLVNKVYDWQSSLL